MLIAYYRVSSDRQGRSGLGLEAQRAIVEGYAVRTGSTVIASYTEVESGRRSDRPQLALALMRLKSQAGRARLIVAKLDRLSRDARFLLELVDSGVDVVFGDFPELAAGDIVGRLTLTVLAAIAEFESRRMSQRQREAAAVRRARGDLMGARDPRSHRLTSEEIKQGNLAATVAHRRKASTFRRAMRPIVAALRDKGQTLKEVATELNTCGYRTRKGKLWTAATVALLTGAAAPWETCYRGTVPSSIGQPRILG
mgnify:CR=1 FL=1